MLDPFEVATFRFEHIAPFVDGKLTRVERRWLMKEKAQKPVSWPQSPVDRRAGKPPVEKPIAVSTLGGWVRRYQEHWFPGLLPRRRQDRGSQLSDRSDITAYTLALLLEEPERSLSQLIRLLKLQFPDRVVPRSTLHRDLQAHPGYEEITRRRNKAPSRRRLRNAYQVSRPHECWQLDGKGPFSVRLASGVCVAAHALSVLDACTRAILAAVISVSESTASAVRVFRLAASKFGIADRIQFDRGSAFDSHVFRNGLAQLGVHRNFVEFRQPEFQDLIEAYHRMLIRIFIRELPHQEIIDLQHLEALLWATIDFSYNEGHRHRVLKTTPALALAGRLAPRRAAPDTLARAFEVTIMKSSHFKTGQVLLANGAFRVPVRYAGSKRSFRYDPVEPRAVLIIGDLPEGRDLPLDPFEVRTAFQGDRPEARGSGQLQRILDV